jgi:ABC-type transport system involved in cytochrome bd biosynthesis fused ATPase/permease subunit
MKPWLVFGTTEAVIMIAAQTTAIPENLLLLLTNLPVVVLVVWLQLQNQKWLEHMLTIQRESLKSIYEGQNHFLDMLLNQMENKQDAMIKQLQHLTSSVEILRGTVSEIAKIDDVVDRLLLEIKRE